MTNSAEYYGRQPLISSAELAWQGVRVEQCQLEPLMLATTHHPQHLLLLYQLDSTMLVHRKHGSKMQDHRFQSGDLGLCVSGECGSVTRDTPTNTTYLFVDEQHLEQVARQNLDLQYFSLQE